jgi:hypothetical protein
MSRKMWHYSSIKIAKKNIGDTLQDLGAENDFLTRTPVAQEIRARLDKWAFMKLKGFCIPKEE